MKISDTAQGAASRWSHVLSPHSVWGEAPSSSNLHEGPFLTKDKGHLGPGDVEWYPCHLLCTLISIIWECSAPWRQDGTLLQPLRQLVVYFAGHLLHRVVHPAAGLHYRACNLWSVLWHPTSLHENIAEDFWGKNVFEGSQSSRSY